MTQYRPKKRFGQHFLKDKGIIDQIIEKADFFEYDDVLEIGPGMGSLTIPLAKCVRSIMAIEKDKDLANMLQAGLSKSGITNVTVINSDILRINLNELQVFSDEKLNIIGNLPYNISSPLLARIIEHRNQIQKAVLMLQTEFARRLLSPPNSKEYGALTILARYNMTVTHLLDVTMDSFYPRPTVDSMVVSMDLTKPYPRRVENEDKLRMIVKAAFSHRRKTILNSLKGALHTYEICEISEALEKCSIDSTRRAETLNMEEYINLSEAL